MTAPRIFTPEYYARMRELETSGWWNAAMRDVAAMLLNDVQLPASGTILDVGCGSGQTLTWFGQRFGACISATIASTPPFVCAAAS